MSSIDLNNKQGARAPSWMTLHSSPFSKIPLSNVSSSFLVTLQSFSQFLINLSPIILHQWCINILFPNSFVILFRITQLMNRVLYSLASPSSSVVHNSLNFILVVFWGNRG